jgi:uncharacterized protein involved in copper resistance
MVQTGMTTPYTFAGQPAPQQQQQPQQPLQQPQQQGDLANSPMKASHHHELKAHEEGSPTHNNGLAQIMNGAEPQTVSVRKRLH